MYKILFFISMIPIILSACHNDKKEKNFDEVTLKIQEDTIVLSKIQQKNIQLTLGNINAHVVSQTIESNGFIDVPAQATVAVSAPMGGYLHTSKLEVGTPVKKGDIIAKIEDPIYIQLQQDYLMAKSKLSYLKAELERQKSLRESSATSQKNYELALSEYNAIYAQVQTLITKMKMVHLSPATISSHNIQTTVPIYAPISGFITKVNANIGQYISPSEVIFEIVNPNHVQAVINIYENDIAKLKIGMKGVIKPIHQPEKTYEVSIISIAKSLNENRAAEIRCQFIMPDTELLPGMFVNAHFFIAQSSENMISENAIVHFEGKDYLFLAKNDSTYYLKAVHLGNRSNGLVAVKDSLPSHRIVTNGAFNLLGAMRGGEE